MKTKLETLTINELYAYYKLSKIVTGHYSERVERKRQRAHRGVEKLPNPEYEEELAAWTKFGHRSISLWLEIEKRLENLEIVKGVEEQKF